MNLPALPPLPAPLVRWRDAAAADPRRSDRVAAILGMGLAVSFTICFVTGLISHLHQNPVSWITIPARPAGFFRLTQGLHVATGIASVPLLLAKLWSVYPKLFAWPPFRSIGEALERLFVFVLVTASVFMLVSGVQNIFLWYPWGFSFPAAHYGVSWLLIGALIIHIGAKLPITRKALARASARSGSAAGDVDRRGFLRFVGTSAAVLTAVTVGETVYPLRQLALLAPRRPDIGPQGIPVNRSAQVAQVKGAEPDVYRLHISGNVKTPQTYTLADLRAMPQHTATLPIACVEGWSANAEWTGIPVRTLLTMAGAPSGRKVDVVSLQTYGQYRRSTLSAELAADGDTLLALQINGEDLAADHGAPLRLIAPNRPGVLQTKWIGEVVVR